MILIYLVRITIVTCEIVLLPLLLIGILRATRSRLQKRKGPRIFQPFYDFMRLTRKSSAVSEETGPLFKVAPAASLAALLTLALVTPWSGLAAPISGDLILFVFLLAAARMASGLAALDTGTAFGGLGASRESALSILVEPTLILALAAGAIYEGNLTLNALCQPANVRGSSAYVMPLAAAAIWLAAAVETSRMPVEDPTTHLELTMIHEAQMLEYSGPRLALVEYQSALKLTILYGLISQFILNEMAIKSSIARFSGTFGLTIVMVVAAAVMDVFLVRLHWRKLPDLLTFGLAFSLVACLLAALRG